MYAQVHAYRCEYQCTHGWVLSVHRDYMGFRSLEAEVILFVGCSVGCWELSSLSLEASRALNHWVICFAPWVSCFKMVNVDEQNTDVFIQNLLKLVGIKENKIIFQLFVYTLEVLVTSCMTMSRRHMATRSLRKHGYYFLSETEVWGLYRH